jgi:hypothetical protein
MSGEPTNPQEAWTAVALAARERLRAMSDDELLAAIRARRIDLTFGIWDIIQERALGERLVREIMSYLVEAPLTPSDDYLVRFHGASALMTAVEFPAEMVECLGLQNNTARRISADYAGEHVRQAALREFWQAFKEHCASRGMVIDWEPPWPSTIPRYRVESTLDAVSTLPSPAKDRALKQAIVAEHAEECRERGVPVTPVSFDILTGTDHAQILRAVVQYAKANTVIQLDLLVRDDATCAWRHSTRVRIVHESDSASAGQSMTQSGIPYSPLYALGYR